MTQPDFVELLKAILVEEMMHTPEDAERLVKAYPKIVVQGIMSGGHALRATAMALEMSDDEQRKEPTDDT